MIKRIILFWRRSWKTTLATLTVSAVILLLTEFFIINNRNVFPEGAGTLDHIAVIGVILIPVAHGIISILRTHTKVEYSDPHLVIWMGLLGSFVGFTLTTVAQDIQKQETDMQIIQAKLYSAYQIDHFAHDTLRMDLMETLDWLKSNPPRTDEGIYNNGIVVDDGIPDFIKGSAGAIYNKISYPFIVASSSNWVSNSFGYSYPSSIALENIKYLSQLQLDYDIKMYYLSLEMDFQNNKLASSEYKTKDLEMIKKRIDTMKKINGISSIRQFLNDTTIIDWIYEDDKW